jgi:putative transcriptional regulator
MTTKENKKIPLTQALIETANDMHGIGILGDNAYGKIAMRHLETKKPELEPLSAEEIRTDT